MGALYLAWDPKLDRQLAIKLLIGDNEVLRERFAREARSAARLRHPHIVTIFDVGQFDGQPFIAMEFIKGQTMAEIIRTKAPLPRARRLKLMEELCDGLGFAHKAKIVHRDIKPANVIEAAGVYKIIDFGIASADPKRVLGVDSAGTPTALPPSGAGSRTYRPPCGSSSRMASTSRTWLGATT